MNLLKVFKNKELSPTKKLILSYPITTQESIKEDTTINLFTPIKEDGLEDQIENTLKYLKASSFIFKIESPQYYKSTEKTPKNIEKALKKHQKTLKKH